MIKINLLGDETAGDNRNAMAIAGYVASVILSAVIFYFVNSHVVSENARLARETEEQERRLKKLQDITKEVKDLEVKEAEYNHKISVIALLKKSKVGPVRVLDELNLAVPERSWISQLREEGGVMRIDGKALDETTIARFMEDLEKSDYYDAVELGETRRIEERNAKIRSFALSAKVNYAGKQAASDAPAEAKPAT